jgi:hypothetical protein
VFCQYQQLYRPAQYATFARSKAPSRAPIKAPAPTNQAIAKKQQYEADKRDRTIAFEFAHHSGHISLVAAKAEELLSDFLKGTNVKDLCPSRILPP